MVRSPVDICFGTSPSQAPKSRPLENASPVPIAATIALEMIGPMPGTLTNRSQPASRRARAVISPDKQSIRSSSRRLGQPLNEAYRARRQHFGRCSQDARQLGTQEPKSLTLRNAALEQEGADLVDDAGALTDQSLPHP